MPQIQCILPEHTIIYKGRDCGFSLLGIPQGGDEYITSKLSIFQPIPKSQILKVQNEALVYLAKQLFGKSQRNYIQKYCPKYVTKYCGTLLDSRDIHLRTCRMNSINHEKHEALKFWFIPGSDKTGTHSNGTSTTYLRSVSTKSYETTCWRSYVCGCGVCHFVSWEGMANVE